MIPTTKIPLIAQKFFDAFQGCEHGSICFTTPDQQVINIQSHVPGPDGVMHIHDWRVIDQIITRGDIGLGETYSEQLWDSPDLTALMTYFTKNLATITRYANGNLWQKIGFKIYNSLIKRNTVHGSQKNIRAHYDVGNDFYQTWLDDTMMYSSGLRHSDNDNLQQAQTNKIKRILGHLDYRPDSILEIGCGWGGFAEVAAQNANVTGITISPAQHQFASARLGQQANIKLQDYRHLQDKFDAIVSIEMFEAVGRQYWPQYFQKIKDCLVEGGKAVIQTITIADEVFDDYCRNSDYIRHYTFPGGMLPSPSQFRQQAHNAGLMCQNIFYFGQDYAWTIEQWLKRFNQAVETFNPQDYSDAFVRSWRFYMSLCIGAFNVQRTNVMQVVMTHA